MRSTHLLYTATAWGLVAALAFSFAAASAWQQPEAPAAALAQAGAPETLRPRPLSTGGPVVPEPVHLASVRIRELPLPQQQAVPDEETGAEDTTTAAASADESVVYACTEAGSTVWQDTPCPQAAEPALHDLDTVAEQGWHRS
ncbi:hypothetical protein [Chitinolyticbacter meiyuanensis]|uniref:hypothetical protein n=1 Tax=Chitinolyticbacter meiyuanensis TaxID=682798 RepID=UPI0011E5EABF|nr:hypothetical protein [Chitinolyticbacter meiyuanensis]